MDVFEVDHPASRADKQRRVDGRRSSRELHYVPADLAVDHLGSALDDAGHDTATATTWVWEGVVPYFAEVRRRRNGGRRRATVGARQLPDRQLPGALSRRRTGPGRRSGDDCRGPAPQRVVRRAAALGLDVRRRAIAAVGSGLHRRGRRRSADRGDTSGHAGAPACVARKRPGRDGNPVVRRSVTQRAARPRSSRVPAPPPGRGRCSRSRRWHPRRAAPR